MRDEETVRQDLSCLTRRGKWLGSRSAMWPLSAEQRITILSGRESTTAVVEARDDVAPHSGVS